MATTEYLETFVASLAVWALLKLAMGIRISADDEHEGVDMIEVGIEAYPEFSSAR